ncbi:SlyX family protein [Undibacterium sp. TS12]|uniref:SlyX family protein n=1 Tax=Undibacterium sp. TS12 TaxID=2908202 RepID=UPI00321C1150
MQVQSNRVNRFLHGTALVHTTLPASLNLMHTSAQPDLTGMAYCALILNEGSIMTTEERLIDLEIRLTRQDDLVDTLNTQVYRQQKKIDELEALCSALAARLRELAVTASQRTAVVDERPPHY